MESEAYLEVTFSKKVVLRNGTMTDLSNNFTIKNISNSNEIINIQNANITNGKIRLKLFNNQVPKPNDEVEINYTVNNNVGTLVNIETGFSVDDLTIVKNATKSNNVNTVVGSILSATVEHETPTEIQIKFTNGRNIADNSISDGGSDGTAGYGITPNITKTGGSYRTPTWDKSNTVPIFPSGVNTTLTLKNDTQEIQSDMNVSLTVVGKHLSDQFDLSLNDATINVVNNVKKVILDAGYISNIDPSSVICYFKVGDSSGVDISLNNNLNQVSDIQNVYRIFMDAGNSQKYYDVSGVDIIHYNAQECNDRNIPVKYADLSGVKFKLNAWPIKYNDNVKLLWDLNRSEDDKVRLKDIFGNRLFNSYYESNAVKTESSPDLSGVPIANNMIKGITIKESALSVIESNKENDNDISYNSVLSFINISDNLDISGTVTELNTTDFTFNNLTSNKIFTVDKVQQLSDPSRVMISVDYNKDDFDKVINKGDNVKLKYTPGENKWPTTIKDQYGNYMLHTSNSGFSVTTTNLDNSGNITTQLIDTSPYDEIKLNYTVDICLNYIDASDNIYDITKSGYTFEVDYPNNVNISEIKKGSGTKQIILKLNKNLEDDSVFNLSYSNTNSIIRNNLGVKLNNESNKLINVDIIPHPGEYSVIVSNPGLKDTFNLIDLTFNPPITNLGNKGTWEYQITHTQDEIYDKSFTTIPNNNVSLLNGGIRLSINFTDNTGNGLVGFSKTSTQGTNNIIQNTTTSAESTKNKIKIKYTRDNRNGIRGTYGCLRNFDVLMADSSNNLLDPSVNYIQTSTKPTGTTLNLYPNQIYIAVQLPVYQDLNYNTYTFYDNESLKFKSIPNTNHFTVNKNGTNYANVTSITTSIGDKGFSEHQENTQWIVLNLDADIIDEVDVNTNYTVTYNRADENNYIINHNGGILGNFSDLPIYNKIKWTELVATPSNNNECKFETGYPKLDKSQNASGILNLHLKFDPSLNNIAGLSATDFQLRYLNINGQIDTASGSTLNHNNNTNNENELIITFANINNFQASQTVSSVSIKYIKPIGIVSDQGKGIFIIEDNINNNIGGGWLKSFPFQTINSYIN